MKKNIVMISSLLMLMISGHAAAEEKKYHIGLATKDISIETLTVFSNFVSVWSGLALTADYDVSEYVTASASYYPSLTEDLDANSEMSGLEISGRASLNRRGFTYFAGLGFYNDSYKHSQNLVPSASFSGLFYGLGIGYNWRDVNVTWDILEARSTSDYDAWISVPVDFVYSRALSISYRF